VQPPSDSTEINICNYNENFRFELSQKRSGIRHVKSTPSNMQALLKAEEITGIEDRSRDMGAESLDLSCGSLLLSESPTVQSDKISYAPRQ